jgi:hypothetical protein
LFWTLAQTKHQGEILLLNVVVTFTMRWGIVVGNVTAVLKLIRRSWSDRSAAAAIVGYGERRTLKSVNGVIRLHLECEGLGGHNLHEDLVLRPSWVTADGER